MKVRTFLIGTHGVTKTNREQTNGKISDPTTIVHPYVFDCPFELCIQLQLAPPLGYSVVDQTDQRFLDSADPEKYSIYVLDDTYSIIQARYNELFNDFIPSIEREFVDRVLQLKQLLSLYKLDFSISIYKKNSKMIDKLLWVDKTETRNAINFQNDIIDSVEGRLFEDIKTRLQSKKLSQSDDYTLGQVLTRLPPLSPFVLIIDCACSTWDTVFWDWRQEFHAKRNMNELLYVINQRTQSYINDSKRGGINKRLSMRKIISKRVKYYHKIKNNTKKSKRKTQKKVYKISLI
jgi:hypothetical protein